MYPYAGDSGIEPDATPPRTKAALREFSDRLHTPRGYLPSSDLHTDRQFCSLPALSRKAAARSLPRRRAALQPAASSTPRRLRATGPGSQLYTTPERTLHPHTIDRRTESPLHSPAQRHKCPDRRSPAGTKKPSLEKDGFKLSPKRIISPERSWASLPPRSYRPERAPRKASRRSTRPRTPGPRWDRYCGLRHGIRKPCRTESTG